MQRPQPRLTARRDARPPRPRPRERTASPLSCLASFISFRKRFTGQRRTVLARSSGIARGQGYAEAPWREPADALARRSRHRRNGRLDRSGIRRPTTARPLGPERVQLGSGLGTSTRPEPYQNLGRHWACAQAALAPVGPLRKKPRGPLGPASGGTSDTMNTAIATRTLFQIVATVAAGKTHALRKSQMASVVLMKRPRGSAIDPSAMRTQITPQMQVFANCGRECTQRNAETKSQTPSTMLMTRG